MKNCYFSTKKNVSSGKNRIILNRLRCGMKKNISTMIGSFEKSLFCFFVRLMEANKENLKILEYAVSESTLEQIFINLKKTADDADGRVS